MSKINFFKLSKKIFKILSNIFGVIMGLIIVWGNIALDNAGIINSEFNIQTQEIITDTNSNNNNYYKSEYTSIKSLQDNAKQITSKITEEGVTLLKNENNALPLKKNSKLNLYSSSSYNYVYQGGGSSYAKRAKYINLKEGLESSGFVINESLWNWYKDNPSYSGMHTSSSSAGGITYKINDANWSEINTQSKENYADAAIFVLTRYGTEATDIPMYQSSSDVSNGNYLELSPKEKDVLKNLKLLKDDKKISKIILLLNSVNQVQCDYINDESYGIDSILWVGQGGSSGTVGIGKVLCGESSPSGKLTDTFWAKHYYNPVFSNFGSYSLQGQSISSSSSSKKYVVYQEGIYSGYRYTETRYEDYVRNIENTGDFNYSSVVAYPFGFGLSYTHFTYSGFSVSKSGSVYTAKVTVKNDGEFDGKESVQLYIQQPYTLYDKENHIEKSAVSLVNFGKTNVLKKGESEKLSISFDEEYFACYDSYGKKTYVVDSGDYYITVAKNAHEAINNILAKKLEGGDNKISLERMTSTGNVSLVEKVHKDNFDQTTYATSSVTGKEVKNQFDNADLNLDKSASKNNSVVYISRNNWAGTVKFGLSSSNSILSNQVKVTVNSDMVTDAKKGSEKIQKDSVKYPTYNQSNGLNLASFLSVLDGKLKKVEYSDARWNDLLNELSWDDTVFILSNALRKTAAISSIGKVETIDGNGAIGPVGGNANTYNYSGNSSVSKNRYCLLYDDPDKDDSPIMYPCAALIGASMNKDLMIKLGVSMGEDCLWAGYSGLYGFGVNIHRSNYSGRVFEYYSEDPVLSGLSAAAESNGIHTKGVYVYMKHAILNEQEKNRAGITTWANEQSIREIYLRPFEIAIKQGKTENIMTAFNRIGVIWSGQQGFLNNVLRDEFGMTGFVVSDYYNSGYMDLVGGILNGNDLPDGNTATQASKSLLYKYSTGYGELAWAMRESVHRILYTVVNSNAMNFIDASTIYRTITPSWINAVEIIRNCFIVFFSIFIVGYFTCYILEKLELNLLDKK